MNAGLLYQKLREARGLSVNQVAGKSGCRRKTIYEFEANNPHLRINTLIALLQAIDVPPLKFIRECYLTPPKHD